MGGPTSGLPPGSSAVLRAFKDGILFRVQAVDAIADRALVPPDEVASILEELVEQGLVVEIDDDRYVITAEGRAALDEFDEEMRGGTQPECSEGSN